MIPPDSRPEDMAATARTPAPALTRRRVLAMLGVAAAGGSGLTGCTADEAPRWSGPDASRAPSGSSLSITAPAADAIDVPAGTEITFTASGVAAPEVTLKDSSGRSVPGAMHPDGAGWLPEKALEFGQRYTATVTGAGDDGAALTATAAFTTMQKPDKVVSFVSFLPDDAVVGVGMPLIFRLSRAIEKEHRAAAQRRLLVRTEPAQEGIWTWYSDTELHWRPREYWQAESKIFVDVRVGGLPLGGGFFGKRDSTLQCSIGPSLTMTIDDAASPKVMKVVKDGAVVRRIPVSLGRPGMPSSSGTAVVIEKLAKTVFDTMDNPNPANRYRLDIEYAQRTTWGGEFIHAAPWSVQDQGKRNVSHGCVNVSVADAKWLFQNTLIGSPLTIKGTGRRLQRGNGWTDFDMPWDEYVKGSAIPYRPRPSAAPSGVGPSAGTPAS
ncbi:lipoprotein-anchoring transpeptidase ErfK/SrfK [Spirilliplanes yamanashiensis]|nr:Ig-like domain-containing protein [Spirilliplanes yamanashiensis]MDP9818463.1 lipoprotein-anchoring transpeptidase ErfK/SrfK [Spirilliplanes yamanashiensis]